MGNMRGVYKSFNSSGTTNWDMSVQFSLGLCYFGFGQIPTISLKQ